MKQTFAIGIGGAAGQGVATPGDISAKIFRSAWLAPEIAYNAYQSIILVGHTFFSAIRTGPRKKSFEVIMATA